MRRGQVVVVGGGLSGLMAAALAAKRGARVRLVESSVSVGGRARTHREAGYRLNLGAHAIFSGGPLERALRSVGVSLRGGRVAPSEARVVRDGRLFPMPTGPLSVLGSELFDRRAKRELIGFLARPPRLDAAASDRTLDEILERRLPSSSARAFIEMAVRLTSLTSDPATTSAAAAVRQLMTVVRAKTVYLHDGWQSLVEDLCAAALRRGAVVETGRRAVALRTSSGEATGVELDDGRTLDADAVILALPPRAAAGVAPDAAEVGAAARAALPVHVACLDLGIASLPRPEVTYALALDAPLYYSVHSRYADLAPPGTSVVHVMRYLRPGEAGGGATAEMEGFLDFLQPGWRERVEVRQDLPDIAVSSWWPRPGVARPSTLVESVPGLYLAGEWVGPEGLLAQACAASAASAAALAADRAAGRARKDAAPRARREPELHEAG